MALLKKLAGETIIYGGSTILSKLLNYVIVAPYLTAILANEQGEYGIYNLMYAFAAFLQVLLTYGMETAFFRFGNKEEDKDRAFSTAFISLLCSTVFFVFLIVIFAQPIATFLTYPAGKVYVIYFAFIIGLDVLVAIPFARLRLENRPIRFGVFKAINVLVNSLILVSFLSLLPFLIKQNVSWAKAIYDPGQKLHYAFIANLIASFVTLLLFLPAYFKTKLKFDVTLWKRMLRYALPLVVVGFAGMINQLSDRLLLPRLLPGTIDENHYALGIYTACIKVAVLMNLFTQAFKYAAEPFFFRHADRSDAKKVYAQVGQAFTLIGSLAFLGIMLYIDIFKYIINANYWAYLDVVPILLLAYLFLGIYYNFSVWYKLTDNTHIGAYISTGGAIITLLLNFILIPTVGYIGAAWAAFSCFLFMATASYLVGKKYYPVPYPISRMLGYLGLAMITYWVSAIIGESLSELGSITTFLYNTILFLGFIGLILIIERKHLKQLLK